MSGRYVVHDGRAEGSPSAQKAAGSAAADQMEAAPLEAAQSTLEAHGLPATIYADVVKEAWRRIMEDRSVRDNWGALGAFIVFFFVYAGVLHLQMKPSEAFEVETTIREAVFTSGSGMLDDEGRVVNRVTSGDDVYHILD